MDIRGGLLCICSVFIEFRVLTNSNSCTASRRNPSLPDRFPLVPTPFTPPLTYNDCNTKPSLVSDMERRSLLRLQLPVKSKRSSVYRTHTSFP
ncbi:hypothetical protein TNCV_1926001 [Trichonephila clavipes]|nr:hypothetical protein TNCV_1926001 [Trichonephila clavipes]